MILQKTDFLIIFLLRNFHTFPKGFLITEVLNNQKLQNSQVPYGIFDILTPRTTNRQLCIALELVLLLLIFSLLWDVILEM